MSRKAYQAPGCWQPQVPESTCSLHGVWHFHTSSLSRAATPVWVIQSRAHQKLGCAHSRLGNSFVTDFEDEPEWLLQCLGWECELTLPSWTWCLPGLGSMSRMLLPTLCLANFHLSFRAFSVRLFLFHLLQRKIHCLVIICCQMFSNEAVS